jgi:DNA-binding MarR family transcriptional regulator
MQEPLAGRVVVVDALRAGSSVLERREGIVKELIAVVDGGGRGVAPLTGEGVVGAVLAVVHARLLGREKEPLTGLLNGLMAMIVLPYLGTRAAEKELARPIPQETRPGRARPAADPFEGLDMRLTYRTLRVLAVIAASPGASNREVAGSAEVADQGQISKLLSRLENLGLIQNTGVGHVKGEPNAWELTGRGREVQQALHTTTTTTTSSQREGARG